MTNKITKILVANRGEIACRVIKTARKMGIATVAVYSDADRKALHVRMADEAVHIGPSPAIESYLVIEKIIAAAKETGADAIHPGYGFLSENPGFVRTCEKAGITFIGPSAESMEAMGLKDAAKKLMDAAGVPITPGYHGEDQSPKLLKAKAGMIGYPVLIKAVAGGGGKGMRKVEAEADFEAALASCQREAKSSFGNADVLIEKYIQSPRHIEVQVFGDTHGNVVHMFERDCSLQRRHQKVIEEAPAPGMTDAVRKAMTDAAVQAAKAVNYVGAGTVEFIVDGSGKLRTDGFWFMEMNTRLQVEHPVTEMITGLDLVELQIRVVQGEKLPEQERIKLKGHSIEARIYAEDPDTNFTPSIGRLTHFEKPGDIRVDSGYNVGDTVSQYYDPMIGKYIAKASTRTRAIDRLSSACARSFIYPLRNNTDYLRDLLSSEKFKVADLTTSFITEHKRDRWTIDKTSLVQAVGPIAGDGPFGDISGFRINLPKRKTFNVYVDGIDTALPLEAGKGLRGIVSHGGRGAYIGFQESYFKDSSSLNALTAPMPGKIIAVNAKAGNPVKAGDPLIIMEAMKMEMTLEAPRDGVVAEVSAEVEALVADGEMLLALEEIEKDK